MKRKRPTQRKRPNRLVRGLFTVLLDHKERFFVGQVWASTPEGAGAMVAPWVKGKLHQEVDTTQLPLELVSFNLAQKMELLDPGAPPLADDQPFLGQLQHVWTAEGEIDGEKPAVYVIETVPAGWGLRDKGHGGFEEERTKPVMMSFALPELP